MGEDLGRPQIPSLQVDFSPFLLNPVNLEHKIGFSSFIRHNSNVVLAKEAFPVEISSELLPQWRQITGVDESQGWFYCLPRFRQVSIPDLNTTIKDEVSRKIENCGGRERKFLVVDQSQDRTTLIFSSPLQCLSSWRPKDAGVKNMNSEEDFIAEKRWINDLDGKEKTEAEGVMEEDSEELDALLYSDSDDEEEEREPGEEDEVTSTGHSPSTIVTSCCQERTEEVASSYGPPIRKRKAFDTGHDIDRSYSWPQNEGEDDAESWRGGGRRDDELEEVSTKDGGKKMRKERFEEIIGILQSVVPSSHGKEAALVIDESIQYLKCLRSSKPWL